MYHSDYQRFGFKSSEIFALLKEHGIYLDDAAKAWPVEYQLIPAFTKSEAALIMCGIFPEDGDNFRFWDDPPAEVERKLRVIDSRQAEILAQAGALNALEIGSSDKISHTAWRAWSKKMGFDWPIPESSEPTAPPKTDEELLRRMKTEEARRMEAEAAAALLRAQVSEMQKTIDDLRRVVGDGSAIALHNTRLMEIALKVQREYWKDLDRRPNQEALWGDLREKYGLSKPQAEAVELVACPIDRKKPAKA